MLQVRRLCSISPGTICEADTTERHVGPKPSGRLLLLPQVPFATTLLGSPCQPHHKHVVTQGLQPLLPQVSPQRRGHPAPPKRPAAATGRAWTRLLHRRRSRCASAGCTEPLGVSSIPLPSRSGTWRLEDGASSMESRAAPGERVPLRRGLQDKVPPAPSRSDLRVCPTPGAAARDSEQRGAHAATAVCRVLGEFGQVGLAFNQQAQDFNQGTGFPPCQ